MIFSIEGTVLDDEPQFAWFKPKPPSQAKLHILEFALLAIN